MDGATATGSRSTRTVTEASIRWFETRLQDPRVPLSVERRRNLSLLVEAWRRA